MLSHYRLDEKIGEGGTGVVWKANDTILDRTVAIKVLPPDASHDANRRGTSRSIRCAVPDARQRLRVIAFILDAQPITSILRHLRRNGRDPYSMHQDELIAADRAPP